jgi:nicotinamidase/pyrazinamidase
MKKIIVLVDCQNDFFGGGALVVPNADEIRPVLAKITKMAKEDNIPLIKTMDCHDVNDTEFKVFPPHCVVETSGQASIVECAANKAVIFNKKTYDVFHPELGSLEIDEWLKKNKVKEAWVAGVATDWCVKAAVIGLCKHGIKVYVFENAIMGIDEKACEESKKEMRAAGASFAVAKL